MFLSRSPAKALLIAFVISLTAFPLPILCQVSEEFDTCRSRLYNCGDIRNLSFPFYGASRPSFCGQTGFELQCTDNEYSTITVNDLELRILNISKDENTITLARSDLWGDLCNPKALNLTFKNISSFQFAPTVENLNLIYDCPDDSSLGDALPLLMNKFPCIENENHSIFYVNDLSLRSVSNQLGVCKVIKIPVSRSGYAEIESSGGDEEEVLNALKEGFNLEYNSFPCGVCEHSGGQCRKNANFNFVCFCGDRTELTSCRNSGYGNLDWRVKIIIGTVAGGISLFLIICIIPVCRCLRSKTSLTLWRKNNRDLEAFVRNFEDLNVKRYKFSAVKRMTKSFMHKLGEGGCGVVYKGKLQDGRPVAVKLLNSSKANGEVFVNEVASICRTSHVNIVTLLGFCLQAEKRALIYEYMPNGSLEKFTFKDNLSIPRIEWEKLLQIATGIARGLEYLHRGCNTKIIHLDIKPHNILLDEDFSPKISDFGLAKLCASKESIVSLMQARGTIGYVAPEVFNRNFGGVSSKSDVYSYGMMILEMVGGRKNVDVEVNHTSEIYFPDWIYKQLEPVSDLKLRSDMTSEENDIARKMIIVGLWCIQTNSSDRPTMSRVIEMLEGRESLSIPPKPTFSLPEGSPEKIPIELAIDSLTSSML